jgi:hypothetical protein
LVVAVHRDVSLGDRQPQRLIFFATNCFGPVFSRARMIPLRPRFHDGGENAYLPLCAASAPKDSNAKSQLAATLLTRFRAVAEAQKTVVIPIGT